MILKITPQGSDANNPNDYFDALRQKSYETSFDGVKNFIVANEYKLRQRTHRKPVRKWQWAIASLLPVLVVLACTKTEHNVPVGHTISFNVPKGDDAARVQLESLVSGLQTVVSPHPQKPGYLAYTCFIPAESNKSADAVVNNLKGINLKGLKDNLKGIKGITDLTAVPVNAQVRASLLSQVGNKIFRTHIDAAALRDDEMQNNINRQLKEQGINNISVSVTRNEKGIRTIELLPGKGGPNYFIDVSQDDKGTRMVLQEERSNANRSNISEKLMVGFGSMTDAQIRAYIRSEYGTQLLDKDIKITRSEEQIEININKGAKKEEIIRFKLR
jgi:hypothetical protein